MEEKSQFVSDATQTRVRTRHFFNVRTHRNIAQLSAARSLQAATRCWPWHQSSSVKSSTTHRSHRGILTPKDLLRNIVVGLGNVSCDLCLPLPRVLFQRKNIFRQTAAFAYHAGPDGEDSLIGVQKKRFSGLTNRLQLRCRAKHKIEGMAILIPPSSGNSIIGTDRLHFVEEACAQGLQQVPRNNPSLPGSDGMREDAVNAERQCDGGGSHCTDGGPGIPICLTFRAQHPTLAQTVKHTHSMNPEWTGSDIAIPHAANMAGATLPTVNLPRDRRTKVPAEAEAKDVPRYASASSCSTAAGCAILAGRKVQSRRAIKPQPYIDASGNFCWKGSNYWKDTAGVPLARTLAS